MKKKSAKQKHYRCWEFFHCRAEDHGNCLLSEVVEWRCWLVNIPCCKIDKNAPHPASLKRTVCKNCEYYKTYHS